jgi:glycosyltransferase involved in cell wall biosynthesis
MPRTSPSPPLKVCHIAATTEGAIWVFEQARELRDRYGFEVSAILSDTHGTLVDLFRAADIPVYAADFNFTSNADLLRLPKKVWQLVRLLRSERFDVIQTHLFHSMVIGRIAAWFADVPVRLSMIAGPFHLEAYTPRWIDKSTQWIDTTTIASCEFTRQLYRSMGASEDRLALIYYGPDEHKFDPSTTRPAELRDEYGWPDDSLIVGMVAYFYPALPRSRWIPPALYGRSVKSQEDLIRAAQIVLAEMPQTRFLFVGSGWEEGGQQYLARMRQLVCDLGLDGRIVFSGFRENIPSVLSALDVAVQPSLSENLGGSIESLLMMRPTVATRVGGLTDSVLNGKTGILVDPSNPQALAGAIITLLRDPSAARQLGAAGRDWMLARFTLTHTVRDLANLYQRQVSTLKSGYRTPVMLVRILLGSVLCLAISLRYRFVDAWLLRHWDEGWRPWRSNVLEIITNRMLLYRFHAFVGRHAPSPGLRRRIRMLAGQLARTLNWVSKGE